MIALFAVLGKGNMSKRASENVQVTRVTPGNSMYLITSPHPLRGGVSKRCLGVGLVLALVASLGVFSASSASAQTGPMAQIWTRKLTSGNVEFGLSVTSAGSRTNVSLTNRYFLYGDSSIRVGTWHYSEWKVIGDDPYRTYARVQVKRLVSGNLEFGLQVGGLGFEPDSKNKVWLPRERYLIYQDTGYNAVLYSSDFSVRSQAHDCLNGTVFSSPDISKIGLAHDCAALLEARDILQGTSSTALSNWNASTPIADWRGIYLNTANDRVDRLSHSVSRGSRFTLSGQIPPHLGVLSELTELTLDGHSLTGSIPAELGNLTNLTFLLLVNSGLTGSIPVELGSLTKLKYIYLDDNNLTGGIPSSIGQLTVLLEADFSDNSLSGCVPAALDRSRTTVSRGTLPWCTS